MTLTHPAAELERAGALIERLFGLHFPLSRLADLGNGLSRAAEDLALADPQSLDWLLRGELGAREMSVLAQRLTIGETYFFRDAALFHALEHELLPELIRKRSQASRRLRIWSAGCATGEEPYSLAMLLDKLLPDQTSWNVQLLATDLNAQSLQHAATGVYSEWSFRHVPQSIKERFFERRSQGRHELVPRIRSRVRFAQLNLVDGAFPSIGNGTNEVDLILCRNVLMYFTPERFVAIAAQLGACLKEDGLLAVSPAEASRLLLQQFSPVQFPGAVLYRRLKAGGAAEPSAAARSATKAQLDVSAPPCDKPLTPQRRLSSARSPSSSVTRSAPSECIRWRRALQLARAGAHGEAEAALAAFLREHPAWPPALTLRARALANLGRLEEALLCCDRALLGEQLDASTHRLRATILGELGSIDEAAHALRRSLYLDPNCALTHFTFGNLALRRREIGRARRCFSNVVALVRERPAGEELPHSEGLTCGGLLQMTEALVRGLK